MEHRPIATFPSLAQLVVGYVCSRQQQGIPDFRIALLEHLSKRGRHRNAASAEVFEVGSTAPGWPVSSAKPGQPPPTDQTPLPRRTRSLPRLKRFATRRATARLSRLPYLSPRFVVGTGSPALRMDCTDKYWQPAATLTTR